MTIRRLTPTAIAVLLSFSTLFAGDTWRFVVTGDSRGNDNGVNTGILSEIATAIVGENVRFVLFTGDLVSGSTNPATLQSQLTTWVSTMQPVYDAGIGVYPVRGNHDDDSKTAWDNVFSGDYALPGNGPPGEENITFSFSYGNAFVAGLDQYGSHRHRVNQTWLDSQFTTNTLPHVFVFGHEPAYEVNHTDCLNDYPTNRDVFWDSIGAEGGRTYFAGHDHFFDHAYALDSSGNEIHQLIAGTAGAPLYTFDGTRESGLTSVYYASQYGYVLVEIDGLKATLTWKERTATNTYEAKHSFSYTAVPEPPVAAVLGVIGLVLLRRR
jgi:hypothetical protein